MRNMDNGLKFIGARTYGNKRDRDFKEKLQKARRKYRKIKRKADKLELEPSHYVSRKLNEENIKELILSFKDGRRFYVVQWNWRTRNRERIDVEILRMKPYNHMVIVRFSDGSVKHVCYKRLRCHVG